MKRYVLALGFILSCAVYSAEKDALIESGQHQDMYWNQLRRAVLCADTDYLKAQMRKNKYATLQEFLKQDKQRFDELQAVASNGHELAERVSNFHDVAYARVWGKIFFGGMVAFSSTFLTWGMMCPGQEKAADCSVIEQIHIGGVATAIFGWGLKESLRDALEHNMFPTIAPHWMYWLVGAHNERKLRRETVALLEEIRNDLQRK